MLFRHRNKVNECAPPVMDDRYSRDVKNDIHEALNCLWDFDEKISKLHPEAGHFVLNALKAKLDPNYF